MPLKLESVGYTYAPGTPFAQQALDGVSLQVATGELVLVLGATGSGKSTLLRIASGLLDGYDGIASIDSEPLTRASARGAVGLVFQDPESQLFAESVTADVEFGPLNLGLGEQEAATAARLALERVGLDPERFGDRSPFSLSGGEARRAAIAGVLAFAPRYLMMDEPTAGLDAGGRAAVRAVVAEARATAGVVVVSHSAEEFLGSADRVLVLDGGRPAYLGAAVDLVADPSVLAAADLEAPDVLRLQMAARQRGLEVGAFSLDPAEVAGILAAAGGVG